MVAQLLGGADGPVDGGGPVDGAGGLDHDGVDVAVRLQLQGEALHSPGGGVVGDGVAVGQPVGQLLGGVELGAAGVGAGGGTQQRGGQRQGQGALWQITNGGTVHGTLLFSSLGFRETAGGIRRAGRIVGTAPIIAGNLHKINVKEVGKKTRLDKKSGKV